MEMEIGMDEAVSIVGEEEGEHSSQGGRGVTWVLV